MSPALAERPVTKEKPSFTYQSTSRDSEEFVPWLRVQVEEWAPAWIREALDKIKGFLAHDVGWDTYDGQPLTEVALQRGLTALGLIEAYGLPAPFVAPTSPGGILFEWEREDVDAQFEVGPDGRFSLYVDHSDGTEVEPEELDDPVPMLEVLAAAIHRGE